MPLLLSTPFKYRLDGTLDSMRPPHHAEPVSSYIFITCARAVVRKYTGVSGDITYQRQATDTYHQYLISVKNGDDEIEVEDNDKTLIDDEILNIYKERCVCCGDLSYILSLVGISSEREQWLRDVWPVIAETYAKMIPNINRFTEAPKIVGDYILFKIRDDMIRYAIEVCDYISSVIEYVYSLGTFYNPTYQQIEEWNMTLKYPLIYQCEWMVDAGVKLFPSLYDYILDEKRGKLVIVQLKDRDDTEEDEEDSQIIQDPDTPSETVCKVFQEGETRLLSGEADSGQWLHNNDIQDSREPPLLDWQRKYIIESADLKDPIATAVMKLDDLTDAEKSKFVIIVTDKEVSADIVIKESVTGGILQKILKK